MTAVSFLTAAALLFAPALASAQAATTPLEAVVKLDQGTHALGEPIVISITNGPPSAALAVIKLARDGKPYKVAANYSMPAGAAAGVVTASKLESSDSNTPLQLGKYTVVVDLDGTAYPLPAKQRLEIVPLGDPPLKLDEFSPASTDEQEYAYFSAKKDSATIKKKRITHITLRGSGFQTGDAANQNIIYIGNEQRTDIEWGGDCSKVEMGSDKKAVSRTIVAQAVSSQELRLCRIPIRWNGGELLVHVAIGDRPSEERRFLVYSRGTGSVAFFSFIIAALLASVPLWLLNSLTRSYTISAGNELKKRLLFLDAETDTYSLSKLQFYLWTLAALFSYAYLFISRVFVQGQGWPDVPGTLPGIIAVSAGTSVGAQIITTAKGSKGSGATDPHLSDFITSGGVVAPERVQMLVWTLFGVIAFMVAAIGKAPGVISDLPPIPDNLLYLMGLSSLGYLGGKMARKPGPVLNEIWIEPGDPDDVIASGGTTAVVESPDLSSAIGEARAGQRNLDKPNFQHAADAVAALKDAVDSAAAARTTTDLNALIQKLITLRVTAEKNASEATLAYSLEQDPEKQRPLAADARLAENAAALLQDFSAAVTRALAVAAASPMLAVESTRLIKRVITLRGTNLSPEGLLTIDNEELPFRMLVNIEGKQQPDVPVREDSAPTLARLMKLTIDPQRLGDADRVQFFKWFATMGSHTFSLTNPDGQKAELPFSLPPGVAQKPTTANADASKKATPSKQAAAA